MKENVFRIYTEQLPKHLNIKEKFIDGYLVFGESCKTASFMFENTVYFKCTRPVLIAQMKKLIKYSYGLTIFDIQQSLNNGWVVGTHNGKLCLENEKTIFSPVYMPKV